MNNTIIVLALLGVFFAGMICSVICQSNTKCEREYYSNKLDELIKRIERREKNEY